jgi:hypothetical protein
LLGVTNTAHHTMFGTLHLTSQDKEAKFIERPHGSSNVEKNTACNRCRATKVLPPLFGLRSILLTGFAICPGQMYPFRGRVQSMQAPWEEVHLESRQAYGGKPKNPKGQHQHDTA